MPRDSLDEFQKELVDSFSEQDRQFVEFFSEEQSAYLSTYYHDPYIQSDEQFIDTAKSLIETEEFINAVESLIENALLSVITELPVLNLLSHADRHDLCEKISRDFCEKIPGRASELLDRLHEAEKICGSVKPMEVGADEVSKHLEWAVRYQVFDEKFGSIGPCKSEYARDKKSVAVNVRKQVLKMLDRVALYPRPATRRSL
jgi:hypothetical protein